MYNSVRSTDYTPADDYLTGLEITSLDFQDIISQHYDNPKVFYCLTRHTFQHNNKRMR